MVAGTEHKEKLKKRKPDCPEETWIPAYRGPTSQPRCTFRLRHSFANVKFCMHPCSTYCCGMMFRVFLFRSIPMFFLVHLSCFSSRGCLPTPTHLSCSHADRHRVVLCLVRGCPLRMSVRPAAVLSLIHI